MTSNERGFTLVEILIAITILSFLMISVYTIIDNNIKTKESVVSEDREFLQVHTALYRMDQDISQMYSPFYYSWSQIKKQNQNSSGFGGYSSNPAANNRFVPSQLFPKVNYKNQPVPTVLQEEKTSLSFMTMANRRFLEGQKQSRFAWVEYFLESDQRSDPPAPFILMRRQVSENIFDPRLDLAQYKAQILLRGVKELKYEFWSRKDIKWVDSIRLLPENERENIRGVKVTLVFVDSAGNERTTQRVFRPLWPYFDVVKDQTERETTNTQTKGQNPAPGKSQ